MMLIHNRWMGALIAGLVLCVLGLLGQAVVHHAPSVKKLDHIDVRVDQTAVSSAINDEGVMLGWAELGQYPGANSAEKSHIHVKHDTNSGWLLTNVASHKRVDAQTDRLNTRYIRRLALQEGDSIQSSVFRLSVKQIAGQVLVLRDERSGLEATWSEGSLQFSDQRALYPACEQKSSLRRFAASLRDALPWQHDTDEKRLFTLGGQVDCTTRWSFADVTPKNIGIYWLDQRFWIGPGQDSLRIKVQRGGETLDLHNAQLAVSGEDGQVSRLIIGRTHYKLTASDSFLRLTPTRNLPLFFPVSVEQESVESTVEAGGVSDAVLDSDETPERASEMPTTTQLALWNQQGIFPSYSEHDWIGQIDSGRWIGTIDLGIAVGLTIILVGLAVIGKPDGLTSTTVRNVSVLLVSVVAVLVGFAAFRGMALEILLILVWCSAVLATLIQFLAKRMVGKATVIWLLALFLAGIGLIVLTQLAAGSGNTRWLKFPYVSAFWLAQLSIWISLLAVTSHTTLLNALMRLLSPDHNIAIPFIGRVAHPLYLGLLIAIGGLLLFQAAVGSEEGVLGIQPVELGKLVLIIILVRFLSVWQHLLTVYSGNFIQNKFRIIILMIVPIVLTLVFAGFILMVGVNDNSPLFLLVWLLLAFLWLAFVDPLETWSRMQRAGQGLIVAFVVFFLLSGYYFYHSPPAFGGWLEAFIPQTERIRIWSAPMLYPEAASQLLGSLQRIGEGGWLGTGWFGKNDVVMTLST